MRAVYSIMMKNILLFALLVTSLRASSQSVDFDKKAGEQAAQAYITAYGVYNHHELKAYVDKIGYALTDQLTEKMFDFHFIILDDYTPNAFALPGGYVFVTRGILGLISSPDELACVMAHEIVHVQKRHSVKQLQNQIIPTIIQLPFKIVGGLVGGTVGDAIEAPAEAGVSLFNASYSRKNETEADALGIVLASRAGFDPSALSGILLRIAEWEATLTENEESRSYFNDHPYTPDRIDNIKSIVPQLTWQQKTSADSTILDVINHTLFWQNPKNGMFVDNVYYHPTLNFEVAYPSGWSYFDKDNSVGATSKDKNTTVYLNIAGATETPVKMGKEFLKKLKQKNKRLYIDSKELIINQTEAYLIEASESIHGEMMRVYLLWVETGGLVYKFILISNQDNEDLIVKTASSLQDISASSKSNVTEYFIHVVDTEQKTWDDFGEASENHLSVKMLKTLNGYEPDDSLKKNSRIKIVVKRPYFRN